MPFISPGPMNPVMRLNAQDAPPNRYLISGVTRTSAGVALGGCTVRVFETGSGVLRAVVTSDAAGNYSAEVTGSAASGLTFFVVAYLAGSPDVAGTTVNTLAGVG
jgi:hypothetical protein